MSERLIYLDQWAWIQLARAYYGMESRPDLLLTLDFIRAASSAGMAKFPLSIAHYLETTKHSNTERRRRLTAFMIEISKLDTIASLQEVVAHEIDVSLRVYFGSRVVVKPLQLLGKGVGHALGKSRGIRIDDPSGLLTPEARHGIEATVSAAFQFAALAGPDTIGLPDNRNRNAQDAINDKFVEILRDLPNV